MSNEVDNSSSVGTGPSRHDVTSTATFITKTSVTSKHPQASHDVASTEPSKPHHGIASAVQSKSRHSNVKSPARHLTNGDDDLTTATSRHKNVVAISRHNDTDMSMSRSMPHVRWNGSPCKTTKYVRGVNDVMASSGTAGAVEGERVDEGEDEEEETSKFLRCKFDGTFFKSTRSPRRPDFIIHPEWSSETVARGRGASRPGHRETRGFRAPLGVKLSTYCPPSSNWPPQEDRWSGGRRRCHSAPPLGNRLNPITWQFW